MEDEEDDYEFCQDIITIQNHGISKSDIDKLIGAGYSTVASVAHTMSKKLANIRGLSDGKVDKIKAAVKLQMPQASGFMTGLEVARKRKRCVRIGTGSKQLNSILKGGFNTMEISEVYGEFRCGKTQLCHTMCVVAQLPKDMGGAEGKVVYIDTEGTFRPERIQQIAERYGVDPDQALENISVARAYNSEMQKDFADDLMEQFKTDQYRLLIVDSVMACFRIDYTGRAELSERQQELGRFLNKVMMLSEEFNICVLMTNQVQSDPGASALFAGVDGRKPIGGHVLAHASTTRILLRKGRGEERVAKIIDSPDCPEKEATYIITNGGISDPDKV